VLAAKVNNFLQMGFRQRIGAGGEGKKNFWRWDCGEGWVLAAKVKKKNFWRWNFGEGWVLAARVNNFLQMGFRQRIGAGGEGKKFFGDGIAAKVNFFFWRWDCAEGWVLVVKVMRNNSLERRWLVLDDENFRRWRGNFRVGEG